MWNDLNICLTEKERVIELCEGVPDHAGNVEARRRYAEQFVMPRRTRTSYETTIRLCRSKPLLNALVLRNEIRVAFASCDWKLMSMCHLYNALRELGYLDKS